MVKPRRLTRAEMKRRALRLKIVLTDSDGVLTDTGVYYSELGEALKRFSIRDGMGVERLRAAGVETAIVSGENSESVRKRSEKLKLPFLFLNVKDKRAHLDRILRETSLSLDQVAYIGDDANDVGIIQEIGKKGLTASPADGMPFVRALVHYRCKERGGNGAFRDFAEWIIGLRNDP